MVEEKSFTLGHKGYVLDMCLDHYGRRLATCSEDGIRIFRRVNNEQGWELITDARVPEGTPSLNASSAVNKLSWSHPEFSMLLACSTDRSIMIWEEEDEGKWKVLETNVQFESKISGLEFGPKHEGLRLAVATCNGEVKIFSPTDAARKGWISRHSFHVDDPRSDNTDCSISWNTFPFDLPSMVVGKGNGAYIWRMDAERKRWRQIGESMTHAKTINHVAWAPNMGRSRHLVATASSDGLVKIWKVQRENPDEGDGRDSVLGDGKIEVILMQELRHETEVFRVEWNLTATMLSTSCDDSVVRLWSPNLKGEWILQTEMTTDDAQTS